MNAEQYPDPESQERVEKRTRAQDQSLTAERQFKEVGLDFGMQFAASAPPAHRNYRAWTERTCSAILGQGE